MGAHPQHPHHQAKTRPAVCAIVTVSDTRTPESDASGVCIRALLEEAGHRVLSYTILPDDPGRIRAHLEELFEVGADAPRVVGQDGVGEDAVPRLLEERTDAHAARVALGRARVAHRDDGAHGGPRLRLVMRMRRVG